jgi:hypothetical protein
MHPARVGVILTRVVGFGEHGAFRAGDNRGREMQNVRLAMGPLSSGEVLVIGRNIDEITDTAAIVRRALTLGLLPAFGPDATGYGLEFGQHRHRSVIRIDALCAQNIAAKGLNDRVEHNHAAADPVGECRLIDLDALASISIALSIERQMRQELGDQHHREQARSCKPAGNRTGWGRRLGDRLAIPARELLAHVLYDLPAPRFAFQHLRHFAELTKADAAAFATCTRRRFDNPFDR